MKQRPRIYYTEAQKAVMWERWKKGETLQQRLKTDTVGCRLMLVPASMPFTQVARSSKWPVGRMQDANPRSARSAACATDNRGALAHCRTLCH